MRDDPAGSVDLIIAAAAYGCCAFDSTVPDELLGTSSDNLSGPKEPDRSPVKTVLIAFSCNTLTRNRAAAGTASDIYDLPRIGSFSVDLRNFFTAFAPEDKISVILTFLKKKQKKIESMDNTM